MGDEHRVQAHQIFTEIIDLPENEHQTNLESLCAGDAMLRSEVETLLLAHDNTDELMPDASVIEETPISEVPITEKAGSKIGPYTLLQQIGEGGFGTVFLAEQARPIRRWVAIKIIKFGMDTKKVIARFEAERQALALMDHPNIARVLDAGGTNTGRPYFVMEYVVGDSITEFSDVHKLSVRQRLELFTQVCEAIQHAHTKGVIHRDIKPNNVLVSMRDGRPVAKVIDFGIVKATVTPLTEKTLFTEHHQLVGTLEYMSPEQADGLPDIDTRTDVYALGVLLYELLTGQTPISRHRLRNAAWHEMRRIIREEEPPAPSTRLSRSIYQLDRVASARQVDPSKLELLLKGELDWITIKAIDKDRARRYETPSELATDVKRHLAGDSVVAAPPSKAYQVRKFVHKNKGIVISGSFVAAIFLAGITGTTFGLMRAEHQRGIANAANANLLGQIDETEWFAYTANITLAQVDMRNNNWRDARERLTQCPEGKRGWEWEFLKNQAAEITTKISRAVLSPDGQVILGAIGSREIVLVDLDGTPIGKPFMNAQGLYLKEIMFSADAKHVLIGSGSGRGKGIEDTLRVFDINGQLVTTLIFSDPEQHYAHLTQTSPDGQWIVTGGQENILRLWETSGKATGIEFQHEMHIEKVIVTPDSTALITVTNDGIARIWSFDGNLLGETEKIEFIDEISLVVSPDSQLFVVGGVGVASIWDMHGNHIGSSVPQAVPFEELRDIGVKFSPDGQTILSFGSYGIQLLNLDGTPKGEMIRQYLTSDAAYTADGEMIIASTSRELRMWDLDGRPQGSVQKGYIGSGKIQVISSGDSILVTNLDMGNEPWRLVPLPFRSNNYSIQADADWLVKNYNKRKEYPFPFLSAAAVMGMSLDEYHNLDASPSRAALALHPSAITSATLPDGTRIVTADHNGIRFWDTATKIELALILHKNSPTKLAFSPDGTRLVIEYMAKWVKVLDIRTVEEQTTETLHQWEERAPAKEYLEKMMAGSLPSEKRLSTIKADKSLSPVRRLVVAEMYDELTTDLTQNGPQRDSKGYIRSKTITISYPAPRFGHEQAVPPSRAIYSSSTKTTHYTPEGLTGDPRHPYDLWDKRRE